ncbi:hypothetical protein QYE76_036398 [Lolium multiflorum]|uniref:Uncharacterized protein n=1 Tax=Lolium multiflorum TaxID=4521 RepID=A0AAD8VPX6_LOLMU|nr:hypothetical protein QYE76_036398 [Lolium multiflorum]
MEGDMIAAFQAEYEEEMLNEEAEPRRPRRRREFIRHDRLGAHDRLFEDYFADDCNYPPSFFRRRGEAPVVNFTVNGHEYNYGYYLADGIYPSWPVFMKGVTLPQSEKHRLFTAAQSAWRKDVECAFGVLKASCLAARALALPSPALARHLSAAPAHAPQRPGPAVSDSLSPPADRACPCASAPLPCRLWLCNVLVSDSPSPPTARPALLVAGARRPVVARTRAHRPCLALLCTRLTCSPAGLALAPWLTCPRRSLHRGPAVNARELAAHLAGVDWRVVLVRFDPQLGLVELLEPALDGREPHADNALLAIAHCSRLQVPCSTRAWCTSVQQLRFSVQVLSSHASISKSWSFYTSADLPSNGFVVVLASCVCRTLDAMSNCADLRGAAVASFSIRLCIGTELDPAKDSHAP